MSLEGEMRAQTKAERRTAVLAHIAKQLPPGVELPENIRVTIMTVQAAEPGVDHIIYHCKTPLPGSRSENEFDLPWVLDEPVVATEPVIVSKKQRPVNVLVFAPPGPMPVAG